MVDPADRLGRVRRIVNCLDLGGSFHGYVIPSDLRLRRPQPSGHLLGGGARLQAAGSASGLRELTGFFGGPGHSEEQWNWHHVARRWSETPRWSLLAARQTAACPR